MGSHAGLQYQLEELLCAGVLCLKRPAGFKGQLLRAQGQQANKPQIPMFAHQRSGFMRAMSDAGLKPTVVHHNLTPAELYEQVWLLAPAMHRPCLLYTSIASFLC